MSAYQYLSILTALAILTAFLNQYLMKMQTTIAITSGGLLLSVILFIAGHTWWPELQVFAVHLQEGINFPDFVLKGVLGFLLFAGGLGINLQAMRSQKWEIVVLVFVGILISTVLIGIGVWALTALFGMQIPFIYCLLFGALISPTDPIAVLAIVKKLGAPEQIAIQLEGESLFNDGVGLVVFLSIYAVAFSGEEASFGAVSGLFLTEAIGGVLFGALLGMLAHYVIVATHEGPMELAITICVPTAGFAAANLLGVSGALAMVVAGIIIGNWTRTSGFSAESEAFLDHFWELMDEVLNALLFLIIGLAMLAIPYHREQMLVVLLIIPVVLLARFASVGLPYMVFRRFREYHKYSVRILSWGGLRGALALAMAVSIPHGISLGASGELELRDFIVTATYVIVIFSILVQGTTIGPMIEDAKREVAVRSAVRTNNPDNL